jgi:hypothetical protein
VITEIALFALFLLSFDRSILSGEPVAGLVVSLERSIAVAADVNENQHKKRKDNEELP